MYMDIFSKDNLQMINKLIEEKIGTLRRNEDFERDYLRLTDAMDELEQSLSAEQKEKFNEIISLFYNTKQYYFALSYALGLKYGEDLKDL